VVSRDRYEVSVQEIDQSCFVVAPPLMMHGET
jgi:hypothetical protein